MRITKTEKGTGGKHEGRPGKLIITQGPGWFSKYRTRQQIIAANPLLGHGRRVILHYDEVK